MELRHQKRDGGGPRNFETRLSEMLKLTEKVPDRDQDGNIVIRDDENQHESITVARHSAITEPLEWFEKVAQRIGSIPKDGHCITISHVINGKKASIPTSIISLNFYEKIWKDRVQFEISTNKTVIDISKPEDERTTTSILDPDEISSEIDEIIRLLEEKQM